jgi:hypothetical protein
MKVDYVNVVVRQFFHKYANITISNLVGDKNTKIANNIKKKEMNTRYQSYA